MDSLRIGFAPGVTPDKWWSRWSGVRPDVTVLPRRLMSADALPLLGVQGDTGLDGAIVRRTHLAHDPAIQHVSLYTETAVVMVGAEHLLAALDEADARDLEEFEALVLPRLDLPERLEVLAAGSGYLLLPASLARQHARKDLAAVPLTGTAPEQVVELGLEVSFVFRRQDDHPVLQDFIGVLKGRRPGSSRTSAGTTRREVADAGSRKKPGGEVRRDQGGKGHGGKRRGGPGRTRPRRRR